MDTAATKYELKRVGKRHVYDVMLGGKFVGEIRRALIGAWVGGMNGGEVLGATFPTKSDAFAAVIARHMARSSVLRSVGVSS